MSDDDIRSDYAIAAARAAAQLTTQLELAETSLGTRSGRDIVRGIAERSELQDRLSEQVAETVGSPC